MGATTVEHASQPTLISAQPVDPLLQANRRVPFNVIEWTLRSQVEPVSKLNLHDLNPPLDFLPLHPPLLPCGPH